MQSSVAEPIYEAVRSPDKITIQDQEVEAEPARPAFQMDTITSLAGMLSLEHEWDDLVRRSGASTVFSTFGWNLSWVRHLGNGKELHIITVRRRGRLIGLAPLMIGPLKTAGITQQALQFIGSPLNDYSEFLLGEDKELTLQLIWERIVQSKDSWSLVSLEEMPEDSASIILTERLLIDKDIRHSTIYCNDTFALDLDRLDRLEFYRYMRKRDVLRCIRTLEREGTLQFSRVTDKDDARKVMAELFSQHREIQEKKEVGSSFLDVQHQRFALDLLELFFDDGFAIWKLTHDDKIIAILQGFIRDQTLYGYFKSYSLDYAKKGPGMIATKLLIDRAIDEGLRRIDFTRGAEPYKVKMATSSRKNKGIVVTNNVAGHLLQKGYHLVKERIMANPKLHARINTLKTKPVLRRLF